jgi:O-methyltransferase
VAGHQADTAPKYQLFTSETLRTMINAVLGSLGYRLTRKNSDSGKFVDISDADTAVYQRVKSYTLTGPERVYALAQAVRYVAENEIPGAVVECGVWKGGSIMAVALTLLGLGRQDRDLHLFDTFEGMPEPTDLDVSHDGTAAAADFERTKISDDSSEWCRASLDLVLQAVRSTGYDPSRIHLVKGKVEDTIPESAPERIALLRLDTDWYDSTRHELEHLFPRLSRGGVIIIDDYGHWQGARQATDEYLAKNRIPLLLNRIDYTARIGVKV